MSLDSNDISVAVTNVGRHVQVVVEPDDKISVVVVAPEIIVSSTAISPRSHSYEDTVKADLPLVFFRLHEADANSHADVMGGPPADNNPWGEANTQGPSVLPTGEGFSVDMGSHNRSQGLSILNPKLVGLGDTFSVEVWAYFDAKYTYWPTFFTFAQEGMNFSNNAWGFGYGNGVVWVLAGGEDNREHNVILHLPPKMDRICHRRRSDGIRLYRRRRRIRSTTSTFLARSPVPPATERHRH